ncbi:MAG TPA: M23 family metallopeptidase [Bacteroidia bacterium]|nr:M23 family metallopeptidase [Bacteroidia bacterium]
MTEEKPKKTLLQRLRTRYIFIVRNEENFEVRLTLRVSLASLVMIVGGLSVVLIGIVTSVVAFTPLREYIPGYADVSVRKDLLYLSFKTDSLEQVLQERSDYIRNIKRVLSDSAEINDTSTALQKDTGASKHVKSFAAPSHADSILRTEVESQNPYNVAPGGSGDKAGNNLNDYFFFAPLKGIITNGFNPASNHFGVDITSKENDAVKATLDGTIVLSTWTLSTGNVIIIQHKDNIISVYEHNSVLMKKAGDNVQAGDVIAIVGNSGELTSGPHLHFELWYQGSPVNPVDYITF